MNSQGEEEEDDAGDLHVPDGVCNGRAFHRPDIEEETAVYHAILVRCG